MSDLLEDVNRRRPTASRPLLGLTVLVVEDSRYTCETMRLMCLRSGARIRRADCLHSARRHLKVYRPSAVIIDLGLPDGNGTELIADLARAQPRVGVIIGMSGDDGLREAAVTAGADDFIAKPLASLAEFQECILAHLPASMRPEGPRSLVSDQIDPGSAAFQDDISHAAEILSGSPDRDDIGYVAQFLGGVARSANDRSLAEAATELGSCPQDKGELRSKVARLMSIVRKRLENRAAI